jgi:hypothetical protein
MSALYTVWLKSQDHPAHSRRRKPEDYTKEFYIDQNAACEERIAALEAQVASLTADTEQESVE